MTIVNLNTVKKNSLLPLVAVFLIGMIFSSCTTLDFESPDKVDRVFRVKIENLSNKDVSYVSNVIFFYIDGPDTVIVPDSTIAPDDPERLFVESEKGAYGAKVTLALDPITALMQIRLEEGTGTGDNFQLEEVIETHQDRKGLMIRYGEFY